jgi:hypothetical protein
MLCGISQQLLSNKTIKMMLEVEQKFPFFLTNACLAYAYISRGIVLTIHQTINVKARTIEAFGGAKGTIMMRRLGF